MRKLASIREIKAILPIEGADKIELVLIDGWQCVSKKGEFQKGDLAVYFEIDSFLPIEPRYEFLRKSSYKQMQDKEGFRIRTAKLRGQLSQGLALPLNLFKDNLYINKLHIGEDITELLGIEKYEKPIPASLSGLVKGDFPGFIRKTDQERIQNLWDEYHLTYQDMIFECSIKLDGTSFTCYQYDGEQGVCSRNLELLDSPENLHWQIFHKGHLENKLKDINKNIAIQGELCGPKIQGNPENLPNVQLFIFDIWDIDKGRYLTQSERQPLMDVLITDNAFINTVPVLENIKVFEKFSELSDLLNFAEGKSLFGDNREGLVFKSLGQINSGIISFKVISNKYLLAEKD